MSIATGAIARSVIRAADPSTKKAVEEKRPTARATPTTDAKVRRGLRTRSRRLYLSTSHRRAVADNLAIAERDHALEPSRDVRVVGHDDKGRAGDFLRIEHQVEHRSRGLAVELAGGFISEDEPRSV